MTITESLFGGLLAVILLYFIGRRCGLSTYWSGMLGGGLPFLAYFGLLPGGRPGGDVLAIHLVIFMTAAAVLAVFDNARQQKVKMHWAPKLIIGFFVVLALINAALLSIATHGLPDFIAQRVLPRQEHGASIHTAFPGTVPHDRNKLYTSRQERIKAQRQLGWQVETVGLDELRRGQPASVGLRISNAEGQPVVVDQVLFGFWRIANRKDDMLLPLKAVAPGEYRTTITLQHAGRWLVEIGIARGQDIYQTQRSLEVAE